MRWFIANSKRKCKYCGVSTRDFIVVQMSAFCNFEEAVKYANENKAKGAAIIKKASDKKHAKRKRNFQLSDRKTRRLALKKACHDYIRARDKGLSCICCNEPLGGEYHAGHWLESGNNPKIRYDEDNIHGQRIYCNTYKGGDSGDYEKNLRAKIGGKRVDMLLSLKGGTDKMTTNDMLALENKYKQKLKDLNG